MSLKGGARRVVVPSQQQNDIIIHNTSNQISSVNTQKSSFPSKKPSLGTASRVQPKVVEEELVVEPVKE